MHCRRLLHNANLFLKHVWHWPWSWIAYAGSWQATGEEACLAARCGEMEATECTSQENTAAHGFLSGSDWVLSVILVSWKQPRLRGRSCHLPKTHTVVVKVLAYTFKEHVQYITAVLSSNVFYNSHFSVMEWMAHILLSHTHTQKKNINDVANPPLYQHNCN